ncbi:1483_t:CDS:1, partial [Scutellospora calospora]
VPTSTITTQSSKKRKRVAIFISNPSSIYTIDIDQEILNFSNFDHLTEDISTSSNLPPPPEDTSYQS